MSQEQNENDLVYVKNPTKENFEVTWGGYPYSVDAGEQTIFPRFIANHFAKHLADRILMLKEVEHKKKHGKHRNFVNSKTRRPKVVDSIITGVYKYFKPGQQDQAAQIAQMVDQVNQNPDDVQLEDYGEVDSKVMGKLEDEKEDQPQVDPEGVVDPEESNEEVNEDDPFQKRTRAALYSEAHQLDLNPPRTATKDDLIKMIREEVG